jgi:hypothetical protein
MSVSMTVIFFIGLRLEKYAAAAAISSSVAAFARDTIEAGLRFGTELTLAPLLKSSICRLM